MADNIIYENKGYISVILNEVEMKANPAGARTPEDKYNRNFAGEMRVVTPKTGKPFKSNQRFGKIIVPKNMIQNFMDYNIDMWQSSAKDEDDEPIWNTEIKLAVREDEKGNLTFGRKTLVQLVTPKRGFRFTDRNGGKIPLENKPVVLTPETVGIIDSMHIKCVDLVLGRGKEPRDNGKYNLWINQMIVYQDMPDNVFADKFEYVEDEILDDDVPF